MSAAASHVFRLLDFNVYNTSKEVSDEPIFKDNNTFIIQTFGVNTKGQTYSVKLDGFKPFFYVMVSDKWTVDMKDQFIAHLRNKMGSYYSNSIPAAKIIKRRKLYGFDNFKMHKFIYIQFENTNAYNKAKNLWYSDYNDGHLLLKNGYRFLNTDIMLYEANLPPLLRFFHIKEISPSGWVSISTDSSVEMCGEYKTVHCDYEFSTNYTNIEPLPDMECRAPYKIMSFDIEASSSHGDFPIPIKSYKKLATNIVEYFEKMDLTHLTKLEMKDILRRMLLAAFQFNDEMSDIDIIYPKPKFEDKVNTPEKVLALCEIWINCKVRSLSKSDEFKRLDTIENLFSKVSKELEVDDDVDNVDTSAEEEPTTDATDVIVNEFETIAKCKSHVSQFKEYQDKSATIVDILMDKTYEREGKLNELNISLSSIFPKVEGDKVTFIGSTFMTYGNPNPHLNHCIVLNSCGHVALENTIIESYDTEKEVLLAWARLVREQNPDIITGYYIFGFDYEFMFRRAEENDCVDEFLKISRNIDEVCGTKDKDTGRWKIEESSIQVASGQHDLRFIKCPGRLQIDVNNYYRKTENFASYKLDYIVGHLISDYIASIEYDSDGTHSIIQSQNLTGLLVGSYIHVEEISHTSEYYNEGQKYIVTEVNKSAGTFKIAGIITPDTKKTLKWGLAKDDVTPKDIFRLTNGDADDRAVIAKYCIQDCNVVHYLFNKSDILTGFVEMAKICNVPINFLVMRGQGIRLHSLLAYECRKVNTLIPVIEKGDLDEGYEGAIVLAPKCDLYLDNPIACNDYSALYPSCEISENISHDSLVWTIEYDLANNMISDWGEKNPDGSFKYYNLPDKEYVVIEYDTYTYFRKHPKAKAEKIKCGRKLCCYVQYKDGESAIIPSILKKLLKARKDTRAQAKLETDDFIKNMLEQRQLGYKVSANSVYGGSGAKTSAFYNQAVAACTTAMGRKLLIYGKRIIEECFANRICDTQNYGQVRTKAEYIYGDTDSVFYTFNLEELDGTPIKNKKALEITIELAQQVGDIAGQFLKNPHDFEYEKTFMPFCLLSKKRYVGILYEKNPNKGKRKEMGIVLKRRDNAPIVKDIYGGIIDILMKERNIKSAIDFLKNCLQQIVDEMVHINKLIISKALRSGYKKPLSVAHKVLADRVTARDPGNKFKSGDRIPYVFVQTANKKALQGDKIEIPSYVIERGLKIDYSYYITNQIMKPVQQLFALVLELIWKLQGKFSKLSQFRRKVDALRATYADNDEKYSNKLEELKCAEIKELLFDKYLRETNNEREGLQSMTKFFNKKGRV